MDDGWGYTDAKSEVILDILQEASSGHWRSAGAHDGLTGLGSDCAL